MNNQLKELFKVMEENPELKVMPMVEDDVCNGDFPYYCASFGRIEVEDYYMPDDTICIGESEILDKLELDLETEDANGECQKEYDRLKESGEIKKAIFIYIEV